MPNLHQSATPILNTQIPALAPAFERMQGNILKSHGRDHAVNIFVHFTKPKAPVKALKGFQRVRLKAGEIKTIYFDLQPEQLALIDENGKPYQPKGNLWVSIGGGQPDILRTTTSNVVKRIIQVVQ